MLQLDARALMYDPSAEPCRLCPKRKTWHTKAATCLDLECDDGRREVAVKDSEQVGVGKVTLLTDMLDIPSL